jgi:hypothetical protein
MAVRVMGVTPTQPAESKLVTNKIAIIFEGEDPQALHSMKNIPLVKHTGKRFE